jgi:hypothetical protein
MKKMICLVMVLLALVVFSSNSFAHCKGPHGPRDITGESGGKK